MWKLFSEQVRNTVLFAQEAARRDARNEITSAHLLLGLIRDEDNIAALALIRMKVSLPKIREVFEKRSAWDEGHATAAMQFSEHAKRAIDFAIDEARLRNQSTVGEEHLLLGVIRTTEGEAGKFLKEQGVTIPQAALIINELQTKSTKDTGVKVGKKTVLVDKMVDTFYTSNNDDARPGDLGTIRTSGDRETTEMTRTADAFQRLTDIFIAKDAQGYREMLSAAEGYATPLVVLLVASTPVKVLVTPRDTDAQIARLCFYIRVLGGDFAGQTGYLRREAFARTGPDDSPFPPPLDNASWITGE